MDQKFKRAVAIVIGHEGGYVYDPDDLGGETKFGISRRSYPHLNIRVLTVEEAIRIYYRDWWKKYRYGEIEDFDIAAKVFDLAVLMGPRDAHMILQRAVTRTGGDWIDQDGVLGSLTLAAVNGHPIRDLLLADIKILAVDHLIQLDKIKYFTGWVRRAID